jgi:hypothetical protein
VEKRIPGTLSPSTLPGITLGIQTKVWPRTGFDPFASPKMPPACLSIHKLPFLGVPYRCILAFTRKFKMEIPIDIDNSLSLCGLSRNERMLNSLLNSRT